jgi:hypothetical protein
MSPYAQDIRDGRAAVELILDELGLRGYVFTIEAKEPGWRLRADCRTQEGWQTIELPVDLAELCDSLSDDATRERLREAWREHFRACAESNRDWEPIRR